MTERPVSNHKPNPFATHPYSTPLRIKRAICTKVVDGDTYDLLIELSDHVLATERIRLEGVDTPEMYGTNADPSGRVAKARVEELILHRMVVVKFEDKRDKYGRLVASVAFPVDQEWVDLAAQLLAEGHAQPYPK